MLDVIGITRTAWEDVPPKCRDQNSIYNKGTSPLNSEQTEGHSAGTVVHRSVRGFRRLLPAAGESQPSPMFILQHEEIVPAPSRGDGSPAAGQLSASSRVFEVWRIATSTTGEINSSALDRVNGNGHALGTAEDNHENEELLGLAKVSLAPSSEPTSGPSSGGSGGDSWSGCSGPESLAFVADGPVSVVDPFSGRAVGELTLLFAVGPASAVAGLARGGRDDEDNTIGGAPTACGVRVDAKDSAAATSMNSEEQGTERSLGGTEGRERGPGKMDDAYGCDGAVDGDDGESFPLLDDSVSGGIMVKSFRRAGRGVVVAGVCCCGGVFLLMCVLLPIPPPACCLICLSHSAPAHWVCYLVACVQHNRLLRWSYIMSRRKCFCNEYFARRSEK